MKFFILFLFFFGCESYFEDIQKLTASEPSDALKEVSLNHCINNGTITDCLIRARKRSRVSDFLIDSDHCHSAYARKTQRAYEVFKNKANIIDLDIYNSKIDEGLKISQRNLQ